MDVGVVLFVEYGGGASGTSVNSSKLSDQQQIVEGIIRQPVNKLVVDSVQSFSISFMC